MIRKQKLQKDFLIAGIWNTVFGYFSGLILFEFLNKIIGVVPVLVLNNVVAISMAFLTYKIYVYKTPGNWLREYLKCYQVYGLSALFGLMGMWVFMELLGIKFWISQAIVLFIGIFISFFLHTNYTFKGRE